MNANQQWHEKFNQNPAVDHYRGYLESDTGERYGYTIYRDAIDVQIKSHDGSVMFVLPTPDRFVDLVSITAL